MLCHETWSFRRAFASFMLAAITSLISGCSDGISDSDVAFVTAATPPQFQSLRMYGAAANSAPLGRSGVHAAGGLHQGCQAVISAGGREIRETVILEDEPGANFDLDATRTADGWNVTSDGLTPPSTDPVGFRTRFTRCVNALRDKYAAEPEKAPFS